MEKKTLSDEITENITLLQELKDKDPTNEEINSNLQNMIDALQQAVENVS